MTPSVLPLSQTRPFISVSSTPEKSATNIKEHKKEFNSILVPGEIYLSQLGNIVIDSYGTLHSDFTKKPLPKLNSEEKQRVLKFLETPVQCCIRDSSIKFFVTPKEIFSELSSYCKGIKVVVSKNELAGPSSVFGFLGLSYFRRVFEGFGLDLDQLMPKEGLEDLELRLARPPCDYDFRFFVNITQESDLAAIQNHLFQFIVSKVRSVELTDEDKKLFLKNLQNTNNPKKLEKSKKLTPESIPLIPNAVKEFGFYKFARIDSTEKENDDQKSDETCCEKDLKTKGNSCFALVSLGELKGTVLDLLIVKRMDRTFNSRHTDITLPIGELLENPEADIIPCGSSNNGFQAISDFVASVDTPLDLSGSKNMGWKKRISDSVKGYRCLQPKTEARLTELFLKEAQSKDVKNLPYYIFQQLQHLLKFHHRDHPLAAIAVTLKTCFLMHPHMKDEDVQKLISYLKPYWKDDPNLKDHYLVKLMKAFEGPNFTINYHLFSLLTFFHMNSTDRSKVRFHLRNTEGMQEVEVNCEGFVFSIPFDPISSIKTLLKYSELYPSDDLQHFIKNQVFIPFGIGTSPLIEHKPKFKFSESELITHSKTLLKHSSPFVKQLGFYLIFTIHSLGDKASLGESIFRGFPDLFFDLNVQERLRMRLRCLAIFKQAPYEFTTQEFNNLCSIELASVIDSQGRLCKWAETLACSSNGFARQFAFNLWNSRTVKMPSHQTLGYQLIINFLRSDPKLSLKIFNEMFKSDRSAIKDFSQYILGTSKTAERQEDFAKFIELLNEHGHCTYAKMFLEQTRNLDPEISNFLWCSTCRAFLTHPSQGLLVATKIWIEAQQRGVWSTIIPTNQQTGLIVDLCHGLIACNKSETFTFANELLSSMDPKSIPEALRNAFDEHYYKMVDSIIDNQSTHIAIHNLDNGTAKLLSERKRFLLFLKIVEKQIKEKQFDPAINLLKTISKGKNLLESDRQSIGKTVGSFILTLCSLAELSQKPLKTHYLALAHNIYFDEDFRSIMPFEMKVGVLFRLLESTADIHHGLAHDLGYNQLNEALSVIYQSPKPKIPQELHLKLHKYLLNTIVKPWKQKDTTSAQTAFEKELTVSQNMLLQTYVQNGLYNETCSFVNDSIRNGVFALQEGSLGSIFIAVRFQLKSKMFSAAHITLLNISKLKPNLCKENPQICYELAKELQHSSMPKECWYWVKQLLLEPNTKEYLDGCEDLAHKSLSSISSSFSTQSELLEITNILKICRREKDWEAFFNGLITNFIMRKKISEACLLLKELSAYSWRPKQAFVSTAKAVFALKPQHPEYINWTTQVINLMTIYELKDPNLWSQAFQILELSKNIELRNQIATCKEFVDRNEIGSQEDRSNMWLRTLKSLSETDPMQLLSLLDDPKGTLSKIHELKKNSESHVLVAFQFIVNGCFVCAKKQAIKIDRMRSLISLRKELEEPILKLYLKDIHFQIDSTIILLMQGVKDPQILKEGCRFLHPIILYVEQIESWPSNLAEAIVCLTSEISHLENPSESLQEAVKLHLETILSCPIPVLLLQKLLLNIDLKFQTPSTIKLFTFFLDQFSKLPTFSITELSEWESINKHFDERIKKIFEIHLNHPIPGFFELMMHPNILELIKPQDQGTYLARSWLTQIPNNILYVNPLEIFNFFTYTYPRLRLHLEVILGQAEPYFRKEFLKGIIRCYSQWVIFKGISPSELIPTESKSANEKEGFNLAHIYFTLEKCSTKSSFQSIPNEFALLMIEEILGATYKPPEKYQNKCFELLFLAQNSLEKILSEVVIHSMELEHLTFQMIERLLTVPNQGKKASEALLSRMTKSQKFIRFPDFLCRIHLLLYSSCRDVIDVWNKLGYLRQLEVLKSTVKRLTYENYQELQFEALDLIAKNQERIFDRILKATDINKDKKFEHMWSVYNEFFNSLKGIASKDLQVKLSIEGDVPKTTIYDFFYLKLRNYTFQSVKENSEKKTNKQKETKPTLSLYLEISLKMNYSFIETFKSQMPQEKYSDHLESVHFAFRSAVVLTLIAISDHFEHLSQIQKTEFESKRKKWFNFIRSFPNQEHLKTLMRVMEQHPNLVVRS